MKEKLRYLVYFGIIISIELFCSFTLNSMGIRKENILMVFIVGVLLISTFTKGYFYGLLASIVVYYVLTFYILTLTMIFILVILMILCLFFLEIIICF